MKMTETRGGGETTNSTPSAEAPIPWEKVASLLGAISGLSLFLSIIFDMGYFDTVGLHFSDVPTTIGDHVRSALLWVPQATTAAFVYLMMELMQRHFGSRFRQEGLALSSQQSAAFTAIRTWTYRALIAVSFVVVWADALTGGQFGKYAAIASTIVIGYIAITGASHIATGRSLSPAKLLVLCYVPIVAMAVYNTGVTKAIEERDETRKATVTLDGQREVNLKVIRYLERGILAITGEGQLTFYRWEEIKKLASTFTPPKKTNWLCQAVGVACDAKAVKPIATPAAPASTATARP